MIDIYSSFLENLISIVVIVLHYLQLINLQLEHKFFISYGKCWILIVNRISYYKKITDQIKIRLISQLIRGILRVFQKLLIYFNGTITSTSFVPLFPV